ncbi:MULTISPECIES: hypothetical protein [unclassified Yoonia]|uniref:cobalamin B12-binding domain-containing protein n=1 Tax=unclassified Yoonia TaxID=2629118 RepID=UPI002AFFACF8|nr:MULTISPECIES: hypothetical protein [unclassified Yoonia]
MGQRQVSFNTDIFTQTASIFETKRQVLPPVVVENLAKEVVRRIVDSKSRAASFDTATISPDRINAFCDALIRPSPDPALRFIEDRRAEGVTRQGVYLGYITGAAVCLDDGWASDKYSCIDVTYGTGHLYALMRALRVEGPTRPVAFQRNRNALFATVPGDDQGISTTVAADMLREIGWEIDLRTKTEHNALVAHIERTCPHIIVLFLSTMRRLDALIQLIVSTRIVLPNCIIGVAPLETINVDRLGALADIDLVFKDVRTACRELDRLIAPRC